MFAVGEPSILEQYAVGRYLRRTRVLEREGKIISVRCVPIETSCCVRLTGEVCVTFLKQGIVFCNDVGL